MAAIAHSDPYAIFMRKIGYSVGLERTLERATELERMYSSSLDVTAASWKKLVTSSDSWGLKSENIKDVFYSLRLIQRTPGDVLVLENLDAMAIECALLQNEEEREQARAFLLLWAILVNDGEIFVNMLLADFEEARIKGTLSAMIAKKRTVLSEALPGRDSLKRIKHTITIERQEKNRGSAGVSQSVASLKRTEPLQKMPASATSEESGRDAIEFSEDYFRKVPPRRKDWARSLGFWGDEFGCTQRGKDFIDGLTNAGYIDEMGLFTYWPMDYELVRAGFRPGLLGSVKGLWDCLIEFGGAYAGIGVRARSDQDADQAVALVADMLSVFRRLHARKAMLRRELPITIAYPAAVARACAKNGQVIDLPAALAAEQRGEKRRVAFRRSRITGGALSLKRKHASLTSP